MKAAKILFLEPGDMWFLHFPNRRNQIFECLDQETNEWFELSASNHFSAYPDHVQMFESIDFGLLANFNLMIATMKNHYQSFGAIYRSKTLNGKEKFGPFAILREVVS